MTPTLALPLGCVVKMTRCNSSIGTVIPAKAGIQKPQAYNGVRMGRESWIPAYAGMTVNVTTLLGKESGFFGAESNDES